MIYNKSTTKKRDSGVEEEGVFGSHLPPSSSLATVIDRRYEDTCQLKQHYLYLGG